VQPPDPAIVRIIAAIEARWQDLVDVTVEEIWAQVPAYSRSTDPALRSDLHRHVDAVFGVLLVCLREDRAAVRSDFDSTPEQARRRVEQGVQLSDFLHAFRIGQLHLWHGILEAVRDDPEARMAALLVVDKVMHMIEVGSTTAAEVYLEAQQHRVADQDRRVRDLFEDLLRRQTVSSGPKLSMLRSAGIEAAADLLVLSAVAVGPVADDRTVRLARSAVRAGRAQGLDGLAATRQDEVVALLPVPSEGHAKVVCRLERAVEELSRDGMQLSVGVSTVRGGLAEVPEAYAEAVLARRALAGRPGFLALSLLSTFDYLMLRDDETALRLVRPEVRRFVEDDLARGGALIATVEEYAACDLNAKIAAERLHMHANTAYYRLNKVAERTGSDLRRFADVLELMIAVRLLRAAGSSTP